jgi:hypothetical protein
METPHRTNTRVQSSLYRSLPQKDPKRPTVGQSVSELLITGPLADFLLVYVCACLSVCLSICLLALSACLSVYLSVYLPVYLYICLPALSFRPSFLLVYLPIYLLVVACLISLSLIFIEQPQSISLSFWADCVYVWLCTFVHRFVITVVTIPLQAQEALRRCWDIGTGCSMCVHLEQSISACARPLCVRESAFTEA